jgi:putative membrane protein
MAGAATLCSTFLFSQLLFSQDMTAILVSQGQQTQTQGMPTQQSPSSPTSPNAQNSVQDSAPDAGDVGQTMKDKMFLRKAAAGGVAEVQLGQLAAQKGGSDDVKAFGQKMVDDHTKLNNDLAPVADALGVRLPKAMNKEDQAEYDKLNGLSGSDFDMEYLSFMVKDHHKDLREFRNEAGSTADPTLREAVENGEKVIHEHMVMVDKLAREKGVPMPTRNANRPPPPPGS